MGEAAAMGMVLIFLLVILLWHFPDKDDGVRYYLWLAALIIIFILCMMYLITAAGVTLYQAIYG